MTRCSHLHVACIFAVILANSSRVLLFFGVFFHFHLSTALTYKDRLPYSHAFSFFFPFLILSIRGRQSNKAIIFASIYLFIFSLLIIIINYLLRHQLLIGSDENRQVRWGHICRTVILLMGAHRSGRSVFGRTRRSFHRISANSETLVKQIVYRGFSVLFLILTYRSQE